MKKYYFNCNFGQEIYSNVTKKDMKTYTIVGDSGTTLNEMYDFVEHYTHQENFTLKGKKKGTVLRNNVEVGTFEIVSQNIN